MTVIDRFLKLVSYPTTSDENSETCPSTPRQLALAEELVRQMQALGYTRQEIVALLEESERGEEHDANS